MHKVYIDHMKDVWGFFERYDCDDMSFMNLKSWLWEKKFISPGAVRIAF